MGNLIRASVFIQGTRPLLWHRFSEAALPLEKEERKGVAGNDPSEWRKTVLVDRNGQLYLDPSYIFSCLREGGRHTKKGRGTMMNTVAATLQVLDDKVLVDRWFPGWPKEDEERFDVETVEPPPRDSDEPLYLDVRGVRNPNTRSRNVRYRVAASTGWSTGFWIVFDKTIVSRPEMEAIIIDAGRLVGLGNGRSIGYGRFNLLQFSPDEV